ncbi:Unknown protein sequence [Pseudomonas amygdali pv. sesami]|nr:Unknown protein sequence [Pseudomonas amygdali pv. sesami]
MCWLFGSPSRRCFGPKNFNYRSSAFIVVHLLAQWNRISLPDT